MNAPIKLKHSFDRFPIRKLRFLDLYDDIVLRKQPFSTESVLVCREDWSAIGAPFRQAHARAGVLVSLIRYFMLERSEQDGCLEAVGEFPGFGLATVEVPSHL